MRWIVTLHHDRDLTILNAIWTPGMAAYPHDHRMWALIGLYGRREDNTFYRRSPEGLQVAGGTQLETGKSGGSPNARGPAENGSDQPHARRPMSAKSSTAWYAMIIPALDAVDPTGCDRTWTRSFSRWW
jgi:hypothetical protein